MTKVIVAFRNFAKALKTMRNKFVVTLRHSLEVFMQVEVRPRKGHSGQLGEELAASRI
jgi:hypothetical protein